MWTVLDRAGNSGAPERIELMERYLAEFGKDSISMLLGDREFIGRTYFNCLINNDTSLTARLRDTMDVDVQGAAIGGGLHLQRGIGDGGAGRKRTQIELHQCALNAEAAALPVNDQAG